MKTQNTIENNWFTSQKSPLKKGVHRIYSIKEPYFTRFLHVIHFPVGNILMFHVVYHSLGVQIPCFRLGKNGFSYFTRSTLWPLLFLIFYAYIVTKNKFYCCHWIVNISLLFPDDKLHQLLSLFCNNKIDTILASITFTNNIEF